MCGVNQYYNLIFVLNWLMQHSKYFHLGQNQQVKTLLLQTTDKQLAAIN